MARGFLLRENLTKDTLLAIAVVGVVALTVVVSPNLFATAAKAYFKDKSKKDIYARARKLKELEMKKLISFRELRNGEVRIELTHLGEVLVRQYNLDNIQMKRPHKWDGKWHILMYDIPSFKRNASDAFRQKIKQMGLFQLQKSVWVSPYDFMPEIEFLATIFEIDINRHIFHIITKEVPRDKEIREFFKT